MKCMFKIAVFLSFAQGAVASSLCPVHTWHKVSSLNGEWEVNLRMINQEGILVNQACQPVNQVRIATTTPLTYGFGFYDNATFDIAYTVTATQVNGGAGFESMACVFVVTARGPAQPDIQALAYHGAKCQWQVVPGVGEDFMVS